MKSNTSFLTMLKRPKTPSAAPSAHSWRPWRWAGPLPCGTGRPAQHRSHRRDRRVPAKAKQKRWWKVGNDLGKMERFIYNGKKIRLFLLVQLVVKKRRKIDSEKGPEWDVCFLKWKKWKEHLKLCLCHQVDFKNNGKTWPKILKKHEIWDIKLTKKRKCAQKCSNSLLFWVWDIKLVCKFGVALQSTGGSTGSRRWMAKIKEMA